jgi:PAS domain S-box-containing protein
VPLDRITANRANLERVLDNLKEGIIAHDMQRRIFFFNTEAERITGFSRQDVLGKDCHKAFGAPFCGEKCSFCEPDPVLPDHCEYPITVYRRNGETRRAEMSVTTMTDDDGAPIGVVACFRDVTDILALRIQAHKLTSFANIVGQDVKMLSVFQQIIDVAAYDYPVHICGETGTGKELVATAIHTESHRAGAPFVPINCGALPENLIESELFGHVKGAFSGAVRDKKGRFELADGGSIFLDEIAELSKPMQVKLLRFLQEGRFVRVGGEKEISVAVKIISATNKDLKTEVEQGRFRDDLYYRLNVIPIRLPPLRERKNDIPLLVDHFLAEARERYGHKTPHVTRETLSVLMDYHWPGNVRELQNAIQFAIVKSGGRPITPRDLPLELIDHQRAGSAYRGRVLQSGRVGAAGPLRKLMPEGVARALKETGGNKSRAARILGVGRATLYRFLDEHPELLS